eukprot:CAMPEP_0174699278 /NCGR_PEP_ID=MMETSP1094-20130205/4606_1 /TAXON_ID=156173 /ORGANISM="Chrysochromulina brevifilum, Strain UTEX LB 985" /LENGTH=173 /DNA_ID=CAMNT_0015896575 /DNA_START=77 /DNA_END=598 /DNA_ORIENTATION=+
MRLVVQRVLQASVAIDNHVVSSIDCGILALVGLHRDDTAADCTYCAKKLCQAKLWDNAAGKSWRQSVRQRGFEILLVSQFTLCGDIANKKHVPDFKLAMPPAPALQLYDSFKSNVMAEYGEFGDLRIKDGVFGSKMDVGLVNDGPVTLVIDSHVPTRERGVPYTGVHGEPTDP